MTDDPYPDLWPDRLPHPETEAYDIVMADLVRGDDPDVTPLHPICTGCNRRPAEIGVCVDMAEADGVTPDEWVRREEGTLNPRNGHFLCDECYIAAGMPSGPNGWIAP